MRFFQSTVSVAASWTAMLSHHGLFSPAMVLLGQGFVASILLYSRRRLLIPLLRMHCRGQGISWQREVWPFQWKIAVSWLCDYFIFQLFTPVLFAFRGPVEAGRMGLSMSIVTQLSAMMLAWMTTKAAPFGSLIAKKETPELDRMFFRSLRQSIVLIYGSSGSGACRRAGIALHFAKDQQSHRRLADFSAAAADGVEQPRGAERSDLSAGAQMRAVPGAVDCDCDLYGGQRGCACEDVRRAGSVDGVFRGAWCGGSDLGHDDLQDEAEPVGAGGDLIMNSNGNGTSDLRISVAMCTFNGGRYLARATGEYCGRRRACLAN